MRGQRREGTLPDFVGHDAGEFKAHKFHQLADRARALIGKKSGAMSRWVQCAGGPREYKSWKSAYLGAAGMKSGPAAGPHAVACSPSAPADRVDVAWVEPGCLVR